MFSHYRSLEPHVYLRESEIEFVKWLMRNVAWTDDEQRNPPDRHLTRDARKAWPIDPVSRRGITPAALNKRIRKWLSAEPDGWVTDDALRLKIIGKNPFEIWLLDTSLACLGSSLGAFAAKRLSLPDEYDSLISAAFEAQRQHPLDDTLRELVGTLATALHGFSAQVSRDEMLARAGKISWERSTWRSHKNADDLMNALIDIADRLSR